MKLSGTGRKATGLPPGAMKWFPKRSGNPRYGHHSSWQGYPGRPNTLHGPGMPGSALPQRRRSWGSILLVPLVVMFALYLVMVFVGRPYVVRGSSMCPTLEEGSRVFVIRYHFGNTPDRGDVVVLDGIEDRGDMLIKRVVAIGGDLVDYREEEIVVNERDVYRSLRSPPREQLSMVVPAGHVFVMGDNEGSSYDSRMFGPVSLDRVKGKAVVVFWPPGDLSVL